MRGFATFAAVAAAAFSASLCCAQDCAGDGAVGPARPYAFSPYWLDSSDESANAAVIPLPPVQPLGECRSVAGTQPTGFSQPSRPIRLTSGGSSYRVEPLPGTELPPRSGGYGRCTDADYAELRAACADCPSHSVQVLLGYDAWRGNSDGDWQNNGINLGFNFGTRLGAFSDWTGIGLQFGGSAGAYNWTGNDYRVDDNNAAQTQGFITYGFFRKANEDSSWSAAIVQDWMLNDNFSVFAQNPTLSQLRGQAGYALGDWNEIGVWGALRCRSDTRVAAFVGPTTWRPVDQWNVYGHHKWGLGGADTSLWFGVPEHTRLTGGGSLGDYLAGASAHAPLNDAVALYTLVTYMHPSAHPGPVGSMEDAWNFSIGLAFYPARNARSSTVAGQCWTPMMPVANNGYFLVDPSNTY